MDEQKYHFIKYKEKGVEKKILGLGESPFQGRYGLQSDVVSIPNIPIRGVSMTNAFPHGAVQPSEAYTVSNDAVKRYLGEELNRLEVATGQYEGLNKVECSKCLTQMVRMISALTNKKALRSEIWGWGKMNSHYFLVRQGEGEKVRQTPLIVGPGKISESVLLRILYNEIGIKEGINDESAKMLWTEQNPFEGMDVHPIEITYNTENLQKLINED